MKKKFLGIISLLYTLIILYVWLSNNLKNFLGPTIQIYIKLSVIVLLIMSIVLLFNDDHKFKISDLILLLPLVFIILSGDGRLTSSFATNRSIKKDYTENVSETIIEKKIEETEKIEDIEKNDEELEIYFDIIDENYSDLSSYLTYNSKAKAYLNKGVRVKGFGIKESAYLPSGYFAIGKFVISCCAADAEFSGFILKKDNFEVKEEAWYEVEGILKSSKDNAGTDILYIDVVNIKEIDGKKEEQYIYPCYYYDNGVCREVLKYNLEY